MPKRVYGGKWPKVRLAVLQRDGWLCQIRGRTCTITATCVDHIISANAGGDWWDEANLRAACVNCNNARIDHHGSRRWQAVNTYITLVIGQGGADLLSYVRTHAQPADLIVDVAALTHSLGTPQAATRAHTSLVEQLRRGQITTPRAWITSTDPTVAATYPHHRTITLGGNPPGGATPTLDDEANASPSPHGRPAQPSRSW